MSKDPAVMFYVPNFLMGSALMTPMQKGHYITLLCYQQQSETGSLTIEEIKSLMKGDFKKQWPLLKKKFKEDGNGFFNERMRYEMDKRAKHSKKQSENAKAGWHKKNNANADTNAIAKEEPSKCQSDAMATPLSAINTQYSNRGIQGGEEIPVKKLKPIGSAAATEIANKAWTDKIWREQTCMGLSITEPDLKKWMAQFNSSVSNDVIADFDESKYKKMLRGWINKQTGNGYKLSGTKSDAAILKTLH